LDRLEASRSAQGLPAALRVGLGAFAGSAAGDSRADFARAAREAGATQDELDSLDANAPGGLSED
jgi:hypothetical protein